MILIFFFLLFHWHEIRTSENFSKRNLRKSSKALRNTVLLKIWDLENLGSFPCLPLFIYVCCFPHHQWCHHITHYPPEISFSYHLPRNSTLNPRSQLDSLWNGKITDQFSLLLMNLKLVYYCMELETTSGLWFPDQLGCLWVLHE